MRMYRRIGTAAVIGITILGLAACGTDTVRDRGAVGEAGDTGEAAGQVAFDVAAELTTEGQALAAMGFEVADVQPGADLPAAVEASADPNPSTTPGSGQERSRPGVRPRRLNRVLLRRNTLHGEVVVQTKDGTRTILVQRGEVTAVTDTTMTVESTDGYRQTWTFGTPIRVVDRRTTVRPKDIAVGTKLGVAGTRDGDASTARLIVVPFK